VLADPGSEDQRVQSAERGDQRSELALLVGRWSAGNSANLMLEEPALRIRMTPLTAGFP
jgi:hypothetical protein